MVVLWDYFNNTIPLRSLFMIKLVESWWCWVYHVWLEIRLIKRKPLPGKKKKNWWITILCMSFHPSGKFHFFYCHRCPRPNFLMCNSIIMPGDKSWSGLRVGWLEWCKAQETGIRFMQGILEVYWACFLLLVPVLSTLFEEHQLPNCIISPASQSSDRDENHF